MAKVIKEKTHLPIIRERGLPVFLQFYMKESQ
jgi:hypothetical protein